MKNNKIGIRFKLDFLKDVYTFDYFFFSYNKELGHNYIVYSWVIFFIGIVYRVEK